MLAQVAHLVDAAVAGRVDLEDVDCGTAEDLDARRAHVVGLAVDRRVAVHRASEDAGGRRLAGAADPGEQVPVGELPGADLIHQRARDDLLPDQVGKSLRSIAAVEGEAHNSSTMVTRAGGIVAMTADRR